MVAITQDTTVQPGGVVQICSAELPAGAGAQVIVLIEPAVPTSFPTMRSLIGAAPGTFKSAAEVDAFLRAERDPWER